jgi:DNA mismatch endonuclease (patch repair protein)
MQLIRASDTKPELLVRRLLFHLGYRYRLHANDLPGKPDIVFRSRHKVIFVHGCFWHGHEDCRMGRPPKSNVKFWTAKITSNRERDERVGHELERLGYTSLVIWQCELADAAELESRLVRFLGPCCDLGTIGKNP